MEHNLSLLFAMHWLPMGDGFGATLNRVVLGVFFTTSGFHKAFHPARRASLKATFEGAGFPPLFRKCMMWVIPLAEFFGGVALLLGFMSLIAAAGLIIICVGATCIDGLKRIAGYRPLDVADWLCDLLYLPEVLYVVMLALVIAFGPGPLSLDALALAVLS